MLKTFRQKIDWWIIASVVLLAVMSLSSMNSLALSSGTDFASRQIVWFAISFAVFAIMMFFDFRFLRQSSKTVLWLYGFGLVLLIGVLLFGTTINGAKSWFSFGAFSFQPADIVKLFLILVLSKYLARRHVEIKSPRHVIVTAIYFFIPFFLIFLQPDFGSAVILFAIWFGLVMLSGLSKRHLISLFTIGLTAFLAMWFFVFQDYQKARLRTFVDPLSDIQGVGWNANQSVIAVGSGQWFGKGVGYGTQSRLSFLPEYETDFIFAAISEEWGFVGSFLVLIALGIIVGRLLFMSQELSNNFERFMALGVALYFMAHIIVNIGMNIGIMPVTGVTLPFVSYGGSHLLVEFMALGIVMSFRSRTRFVYHHQNSELML
jgi:rod shape determining protein RodA